MCLRLCYAIIYAGSFRGRFCTSNKEAEARAIIFTLSKAREFQLHQIIICQILLKFFVGLKERRIEFLRSCVMKILDVATCFASIRFRHFSRDLNVAAHALAQFCSKFGVNSEYFENFSNWLIRYLCCGYYLF